MEKYSKYKNSDIEWLGVIPEHWEIKRGQDIFIKLKRNVRPQDEIVTCFRRGLVTLRKNVRNDGFTNSLYEIGYQGIRENDLIIHEMDAFAGAIGISDSDGKGSPILMVLNCINGDVRYYNYLIRAMSTRGYIMALWKGIRVRSVDFRYATLKRMSLVSLSLKEQTQIATYLDAKTTAIDKKVNLLQQKIKHYKAYRKTLINETVTKGLDKTVKLKDSGINWIGEIPEHWEVKRYKSFGKTIKGKNMEMSDLEFDNSLPLLSLEYLRNDSVQHPTFCYSKDKSLKSTDEDLIIVWDGAAVGEILKSKVGYISSTIAKLDINKKKFNTRYFYHLRGAIDYKLKQIPTGMGIPHLNPTLFKNFKCPSPTIKEQQQIANYLDAKTTTIDNIVKNIETQITTLKELRKTLINEVVTGKVKVSA